MSALRVSAFGFVAPIWFLIHVLLVCKEFQIIHLEPIFSYI